MRFSITTTTLLLAFSAFITATPIGAAAGVDATAEVAMSKREAGVTAPRKHYDAAGKAHLNTPVHNKNAPSPHNNPHPVTGAAHKTAQNQAKKANKAVQKAKAEGQTHANAAHAVLHNNHNPTAEDHAKVAHHAGEAAKAAHKEAAARQKGVNAHRQMGTSNVGHEHAAVKSGHDAKAWEAMSNAHHAKVLPFHKREDSN